MESGLASRTIPMDRHRFSSLYPRPTFWSEHTHIKPRKRTKNEKILSLKTLVNSYRIVSDPLSLHVYHASPRSKILSQTWKNVRNLILKNSFSSSTSHLLSWRNYFSWRSFYIYVCAHRKIGLSSKKCQLVSLFMECNSVCIFLRSRKLPSSHTNMWISSACMLTSHIESSFPELRRFWLTDDDVRKKSLFSSN